MKTLIKNPIIIIGCPVGAFACFAVAIMCYNILIHFIIPALVWWWGYVPLFF